MNYRVFVDTPGVRYLLGRLSDANKEIRSLRHRLDIERGVWHAALKAMVNSDGFGKLEKLLNDFLVRLGR